MTHHRLAQTLPNRTGRHDDLSQMSSQLIRNTLFFLCFMLCGARRMSQVQTKGRAKTKRALAKAVMTVKECNKEGNSGAGHAHQS
jgi:hypothetical protein